MRVVKKVKGFSIIVNDKNEYVIVREGTNKGLSYGIIEDGDLMPAMVECDRLAWVMGV